jgi:His-Xaa-Ser system radical SAM maturase HxsC
MLKLSGKVISIAPVELMDVDSRRPLSAGETHMLLPLVSNSRFITKDVRRASAFLIREGSVPDGYRHYFMFERDACRCASLKVDAPLTVLSNELDYLDDGDIVRLNRANGMVRVLYRRSSPHNTIMVTERCQHYCLMCSQPPKNLDDGWLDDEAKALIRLIPQSTETLGFTGGEPTLLGDRFLETLRLAKALLPRTKLHVLSNGRRFADPLFARSYAAIGHPDLTVGIPVYSDDAGSHDYVVQSKGAFDETVRGILNLKELGQKVEVRVVLHRLSINRLEKLATFLTRNLLFVDHVALMGIELTGFSRANLETLWIDPFDYKDILSRAVRIIEASGMQVSVYNHQLCVVNSDTEKAYRRSISDWKNEYVEACAPCRRKHECGGFFASGVQYKHSAHIRPFETDDARYG